MRSRSSGVQDRTDRVVVVEPPFGEVESLVGVGFPVGFEGAEWSGCESERGGCDSLAQVSAWLVSFGVGEQFCAESVDASSRASQWGKRAEMGAEVRAVVDAVTGADGVDVGQTGDLSA